MPIESLITDVNVNIGVEETVVVSTKLADDTILAVERTVSRAVTDRDAILDGDTVS